MVGYKRRTEPLDVEAEEEAAEAEQAEESRMVELQDKPTPQRTRRRSRSTYLHLYEGVGWWSGVVGWDVGLDTDAGTSGRASALLLVKLADPDFPLAS